MKGYIQEEPQGSKWLFGLFSEVGYRNLEGKLIQEPFFGNFIVDTRKSETGTPSEIQKKAREEFGTVVVYVTEDDRLCFGGELSQPQEQQPSRLRRIFAAFTNA